MMEVVELFRNAGTIDELGIGAIRDTISDALFPATSVLHTRARYLLFVPWLLQQASHQQRASEMVAQFRRLEIRLIGSLITGGETEGVIGQQARETLKQTPAQAYWAALRTLGIRTVDGSPESLFRRMKTHQQLAAGSPSAGDPDATGGLPRPVLDPALPPAPDDLLKATTFKLTLAEESYLSDRVATATKGSLYAWLVRHWSGDEVDTVWHLDTNTFPRDMAIVVDHGRRFHTAVHGAALLYNLMMAEMADREDLVNQYRGGLDDWRDELAVTRVMEDWNRNEWWATLSRHNPRINQMTRDFVNKWLDIVAQHAHVEHNDRARRLINRRERMMKGGRARLANRAALDRWGGDSGLGRLTYRWEVARAMLTDLYAARNGGS